MAKLKPGVIAFADMDARQSAKWCSEQALGTSGSISTSEINDLAVTYAKIQAVTANRILGRLSTTGTLQELTAAQVASLIEAVAWAFSGAVTFTGTVGFFGAAAVGRQTDPGSATIATVTGSGADTDINNNFTALDNKIDQLRTILNTFGLTG